MGHTLEQRSIITLHLLGDIGPRRFAALVDYFGSAADALAAPADAVAAVDGMTPALARAVAQARQRIDVDRELALAAQAGARILTCGDPDYPQELKNLTACPPVVYIRGTLTDNDIFSVALVGTRHPTPYGRNVATRFARDFAAAGVTTVSGLARGIDTEVHAATLAAGGRTIAVLGNGLNRHYPPENRALEEKIAARGALVSEFPMEMQPDRCTFPRRNRIISGLALATVVVEAGLKSGALITAGFALEQGKDVFAVPGPVQSKYSAGPHSLLRQGAQVAESADNVLAEVQPLAAWRARRRQAPPPDLPPADDAQRLILAALEGRPDGMTIDRLSAVLGRPSAALAKSLLELELKGRVRNLPGNVYAKIG